MRKALLLVPAAFLATACVIYTGDAPAQANYGTATERDFNYTGFDKVSASAGVTVIMKQGPYAVHARSTNGDLSRLVLEVRGDTLVAGRNNNGFNWIGNRGPNYTITVSAPNYSGVKASSGSSVDGSGITARDMRVDVSSGADVDLAGSCTSLSVHISSGADFDGERLQCETASVSASSGSDADAYATRTASGDASSGADITFHGRPASVSKDTSSGGSVRAL